MDNALGHLMIRNSVGAVQSYESGIHISHTSIETHLTMVGELVRYCFKFAVTAAARGCSHIIVWDTVCMVVRDCRIGEEPVGLESGRRLDGYLHNFILVALTVPKVNSKDHCNAMAWKL